LKWRLSRQRYKILTGADALNLWAWAVDNSGGDLMAVQLMCPNLKCRKILAVPEDCRGKLVKCQHCQMTLKVPAPKAEVGKAVK